MSVPCLSPSPSHTWHLLSLQEPISCLTNDTFPGSKLLEVNGSALTEGASTDAVNFNRELTKLASLSLYFLFMLSMCPTETRFCRQAVYLGSFLGFARRKSVLHCRFVIPGEVATTNQLNSVVFLIDMVAHVTNRGEHFQHHGFRRVW